MSEEWVDTPVSLADLVCDGFGILCVLTMTNIVVALRWCQVSYGRTNATTVIESIDASTKP